MARIFFGISLQDFRLEAESFLNRLKAQIPGGVKWVDPAQFHVTLAFLGEQGGEKLDAAVRIGHQARCRPVSFALEGAGAFPERGIPRVLWVGLKDPEGALQKLHACLRGLLLEHGFALDARAFVPHLTLGRVKDGAKIVLPEDLRFPETPLKILKEFVLYESKTAPSGPRYEVLEKFPLA